MFPLVIVAFAFAAVIAIVAARRSNERLTLTISLSGMLLLGALALLIVLRS
jgi:hypothetical protein